MGEASLNWCFRALVCGCFGACVVWGTVFRGVLIASAGGLSVLWWFLWYAI